MSTDNMSEADQAYKAAQEEIARVKRDGDVVLALDEPAFQNLLELPPEIADLDRVIVMDLNSTQVSDLSPIAGLTQIKALFLRDLPVTDISALRQFSMLDTLFLSGASVSDLSPLADLKQITFLYINDTAVTDLTPLLHLIKLVDDPQRDGLTFKNCAAARNDPKIAEIAEIKDDSNRARTLFEYLREQETPEPDATIPVRIRDGKIDSDPTHPDAADPLKKKLHDRLRTKAATLANAAGNQFPKLCGTARSILKEAEKPFDDLDLISLFLDTEALKDWETAGGEDGMDYPDEVTIPLAEVTRTAPGLTLGDPHIDTLVERINRSKGIEPPKDEVAHQSDMADVIKADDAAVGDLLRHQQMQLATLNKIVAHQIRKPSMRNVLLVIAGNISLSITAAGLSPPVLAMVQSNWPIFAAAAETYGQPMLHYFASSFTRVPLIAEQARATLQEMQKRRKK